jgi:hypothetical protein
VAVPSLSRVRPGAARDESGVGANRSELTCESQNGTRTEEAFGPRGHRVPLTDPNVLGGHTDSLPYSSNPPHVDRHRLPLPTRLGGERSCSPSPQIRCHVYWTGQTKANVTPPSSRDGSHQCSQNFGEEPPVGTATPVIL